MPTSDRPRAKDLPARPGRIKPASAPFASPTPSQGDHIRMLIELLQPTGPDLARRWLAALLLVPRDDRLSVVESVEQRIASMYESDAPAESTDDDEIDIVFPPVQRKGYVEQTHKTYARKPEKGEDRATADDASRRGTG